jgi:cytochrome c-type biogenesis protein CcmH
MKYAVTALLLGLLLGSPALYATTTLESYHFSDHKEELRFKDLISQLRCLVCQNESLADSDADLAHDLRQEVYEMMLAGKSDKQVTDYLVQRYGDFVLYKPPFKPSTWLIWFGPFGVLLIALWLLLRAVRRQRSVPDPELSAAERKRVEDILQSRSGGDTRS